MDNGEKYRLAECLPEGVIVMLLTGYLETIKDLKMLLGLTVCCWLITILVFIYR